MEYTVQKLARLAGISARTIRFYDEIGLLSPARVTGAGYRIYGEREVDALQQILFFRALGLNLETIGRVMHDDAFDRLAALKSHLHALSQKRAQLSRLMETVAKTIEKEEGIRTMTDAEKFAGLKRRLVDENEAQYGGEIRAKYGEAAVAQSHEKLLSMGKEAYDGMQRLSADLLRRLADAVKSGASPQGDVGRDIARLHKDWLCHTWPRYTKEAHLGLVRMYLEDARFAAYYDAETPGCAQLLHDAVHAWQGVL